MRDEKRVTFEKKRKRQKSAAEPTATKPEESPPIFIRNFDPRTRFNFPWTPPATPAAE
jgi:hypothetical protein